MKLGIKQSILLTFIIGILTYAVVYISQNAFQPLISEQRELGEDITFQKALEENVKSNVSQLLERLYGKKNYFVSVVAHLHETSEEVETVTYEPVIISENYTETYESEFDTFREELQKQKPSVNEIRSRLLALEDVGTEETFQVPGLISMGKLSDQITEDLPGFPFIYPDNMQEQPDRTTVEPDAEPGAAPAQTQTAREDQGESKGRQKANITRGHTKDVIVYNQTKKKEKTPKRAIERLIVTVLVDETRFELAGIENNTLEEYIKNIASYKEERGDELSISVFPFPANTVDIGSMYLKYKPQIDQAIAVIPKFKWVFVVMLVIVLIIGVIYGLIKLMRLLRRNRLTEALEEQKMKAELEEQQAIKQASEMEQKRVDIMMMAKSKPNEFARSVLNWVEKSTN